MTQSKVSFLMPVRNAGEFITSAIRSTLKTMHGEDRLLVVIDASTDDSEEIAREFAREDPRVRVLENLGDHGVANALNFGLAQIETEFVARIDADDACLPWRRRVAMRHIRSKNLDFFFTTAILFGNGVRFPAPQPFVGIETNAVAEALALNNPMVHSSMVARTQAIRQLGGYVQGPAEDYDLWARACLAGYRMYKHAAPSVLFRVHQAQLTRSRDWVESLETPASVLALRESLGVSQRRIGERLSFWGRAKSWYLI